MSTWLKHVFIHRQIQVRHHTRYLCATECHLGLKHLRKIIYWDKMAAAVPDWD